MAEDKSERWLGFLNSFTKDWSKKTPTPQDVYFVRKLCEFLQEKGIIKVVIENNKIVIKKV